MKSQFDAQKRLLSVLSLAVVLCTNSNMSFAETSKPVSDSDGDFDFAQELIDVIKNNTKPVLPVFNSQYLAAAEEAKSKGLVFQSAIYYCTLLQDFESPKTAVYLGEIKQLFPQLSPLEKSLILQMLYKVACASGTSDFNFYTSDLMTNYWMTKGKMPTPGTKSIIISDQIAILELALNLLQNIQKHTPQDPKVVDIYLSLCDRYAAKSDFTSAIKYLKPAIELDKLDWQSDAIYKHQLQLINLYESLNDSSSEMREVKVLDSLLLNNQASAFAKISHFQEAIDLSTSHRLLDILPLLRKKQLEVALFCLRNLSNASQTDREHIRIASARDLFYIKHHQSHRPSEKTTQLKQVLLLLEINNDPYNKDLQSFLFEGDLNPYLKGCSPKQINRIRETLKTCSILRSAKLHFLGQGRQSTLSLDQFLPVPTNDFDFAEELVSSLENNTNVYLPNDIPNNLSHISSYSDPRQEFNNKYLDAAEEAKSKGQAFHAAICYCTVMQASEPPDTQKYLIEVKQLLVKMSPFEKSIISKLLCKAVRSRFTPDYHMHQGIQPYYSDFRVEKRISDKMDMLKLAIDLAPKDTGYNSQSNTLNDLYLLLSSQYISKGDYTSAISYLRLAIQAEKLDLSSDAVYKHQLELINLYKSLKNDANAKAEINVLVNLLLNDQASAFARMPYFDKALDICNSYALQDQYSLLSKKRPDVALFCLHNLSKASQANLEHIYSSFDPGIWARGTTNYNQNTYNLEILELDPSTDLRLRQIQFLLHLKTSRYNPFRRDSESYSVLRSLTNLNPYLINCTPDQINKVKETIKTYSILKSADLRLPPPNGIFFRAPQNIIPAQKAKPYYPLLRPDIL